MDRDPSSAANAPSSSNASSPWSKRVGYALSALPALMLLASAGMKLSHAPGFVKQWTSGLGFTESTLTPIGVVELVCVLTYLVPKTALLGAVLLAAYLGGAVAIHVRAGDVGGIGVPIALGVLAWVGLYLREEHLRALAPLRKAA